MPKSVLGDDPFASKDEKDPSKGKRSKAAARNKKAKKKTQKAKKKTQKKSAAPKRTAPRTPKTPKSNPEAASKPRSRGPLPTTDGASARRASRSTFTLGDPPEPAEAAGRQSAGRDWLYPVPAESCVGFYHDIWGQIGHLADVPHIYIGYQIPHSEQA